MSANSEITILVVDDTEAGRYTVARILRSAGYQVLEASTGQQALALAERRPELVILDVNLPDISGFEVCRRLKQQPDAYAPVVLHLSATFVGDDAKVEGLEGGADGYLTQPVEPGVLLAHIRSLLRLHAAEKRLKAERDFTNSILDTVGAAVVVVRADGSFVRVNRQACEWSECSPEQLAEPGALRELVPPDERARVASVLEMVARTGEPVENLNHWVAKSGDKRLLQWSNSAVRNAAGEVEYVIGAAVDVTARERAVAALARSEARFRTLFDQAGVGVAEIESHSGVFLDANSRYAEILGYRVEDLVGLTWQGITHQEDIAEENGQLQSLLSGATRECSLEKRHIHRSGAVVWVRLTISPMWRSGEAPVSHICVAEDITRRKLAEEERVKVERQLQQAQRMEAVGQLAGGIAHDFNNLLTVINGYTEMLLDGLTAADPLRRELSEIHKAGGRAADLTQQLLTFSRRQIVEPRVMDLNELISETKAMLQRLIGEDIELLTELAPALGPVRADPSQMHQVLVNLAANARDAMPSGGTLIFETAEVELDADYVRSHPEVKQGSFVLLAVTDTGIGMDAETQARVFEPFFTTKQIGAGTGLGLATVHGIVRQNGGWIWVYSEKGLGTTFKIYLPRITAPLEPGDVVLGDSLSLRGTETILVVEDHDEVRQFTATALRSLGYRVLEAASGDEALAIAEHYAGPIELLLTDVVMPQMNGRELQSRLQPSRPEVKVLFMSGYTKNVIANRGVLYEGVNFLAKPFTPHALARKVRTVLGPGSPKGKILVADDDDSIRGIFAHVLESAGYQVLTARDGDEALRVGRVQRVDLAIIDLVMPKKEGLETIQMLRREYPQMKIVAVSGAFGGDFLQTAQLLGADTTLLKPVSPSNLLNAVKQMLE